MKVKLQTTLDGLTVMNKDSKVLSLIVDIADEALCMFYHSNNTVYGTDAQLYRFIRKLSNVASEIVII